MNGHANAGHDASQHGPRPLPLFLQMLRSETAASLPRRRAALAGLAAYQSAARVTPPRPMPAIARAGRACLRDYGGDGPPLVFVPSLINPPAILDLACDNSLLRWIATRGFHAHLVDWGTPTPADAECDISAHVERLLLPLLAALDRPPLLAGYCLGGTMALAAAAVHPVAAVATLAAPWHFAGYCDARDEIARWWQGARPGCAALGLVPMEVLQAGFWGLDPARTIAKYERFAALDPASAAAHGFVALEDWANAGAPLPFAAGAELFEQLVAEDLPGRGRWRVAGTAIDPARIGCPTIEFVARGDRIVPAATAAGLAARRDVPAGHVGMVVGRSARGALWEPLADWLGAVAGSR